MTADEARAILNQIARVEAELIMLRELATRALQAEPLTAADAFEQQFPVELIYHITPRTYYESFAIDAPYLPEAYAKDGFIHCTRGADLMVEVANKHYRKTPGDYLMLLIDPRALTAPLKFEALDPSVLIPFPHIYGAINRDAIRGEVLMRRDADGTFLAPPFKA